MEQLILTTASVLAAASLLVFAGSLVALVTEIRKAYRVVWPWSAR